MNVLAVGAHPDDIETYCGGTLAKYAAQGHSVTMCIACNGNCGSAEYDRETIVKIRHKEAQASADLIGAKLIWMGNDDAVFFNSPEQRIRFIEMVREAKPDVILTHSLRDYNPDHETTANIVHDVVPLLPLVNLPAKGYMETIPKVYYWETQSGLGFLPTEYVDISDYMETKKRMLACHVSQVSWMKVQAKDTFDTLEKGGFFEGIEIQSRYRGLQCSVMYAEGFIRAYDAFRVCAGTMLP